LSGRLAGNQTGMSEGVLVFAPAPLPTRSAGLRPAKLAPFGQVQMAIAEAGEGYVRVAIEEDGGRRVPGTDVALQAEGYATVTPIRPPCPATEIALPADLA
jgi:5'-nucleotidase